MSTWVRLASFIAIGAAVLGAGAALGTRFTADADDHGTEEAEPRMAVGEGVVVTAEGYRLVPASTELAAAGGQLIFTVLGPDGSPVHRFDTVHERDLHLVVASRDLTAYHHLHPRLEADGSWSVDVPAVPPGSYRAIADFQVSGGPHLVLGTDLGVAGEYRPAHPGDPAAVASVDGYEVTVAYDDGGRRDGTVEVTMTVRRGGELVDDLQPYLGAMGHLVALRSGDLAYAHVHPHDTAGDPGVVRFDAELAAPGRYRLFFDFQHEGTVRTAAFTFDQGLVIDAPSMEH